MSKHQGQPHRLPDSFPTQVMSSELDALFQDEGRKLARAVDGRRGRRLVAMLNEAGLRGVAPALVEFYARTTYEAFLRELTKPPRGNTHERNKPAPAIGRNRQ